MQFTPEIDNLVVRPVFYAGDICLCVVNYEYLVDNQGNLTPNFHYVVIDSHRNLIPRKTVLPFGSVGNSYTPIRYENKTIGAIVPQIALCKYYEVILN